MIYFFVSPNGFRSKLWIIKLQEFTDITGLDVYVCHFPSGTFKWNEIEHGMFSQISVNWNNDFPICDTIPYINEAGKTSHFSPKISNRTFDLLKQPA